MPRNRRGVARIEVRFHVHALGWQASPHHTLPLEFRERDECLNIRLPRASEAVQSYIRRKWDCRDPTATVAIMAKCGKRGFDRCYYGTIIRKTDASGNKFVFSRIVVPDGLLCASAPNQDEVGKNLDKLCKMAVDEGLHNDAGISIEIFGNVFFLN